MNPFLAELYNTATNIGSEAPVVDDTEKLAQAAVLDQMLQNEGHSLADLSPADRVKVAQEIFGPDSPLVKEAMEDGESYPEEKKVFPPKKKKEEEEKEDEEKEAQEKLAEADFLGRAMAHAYVAELADIEKKAQVEQPQAVPQTLSGLLNKEASQQQAAPSALDILAQQRAEEMLKQAGIQPEPDQLEQAVQARAIEMLKEAGYDVR
jgi:hypothetical protein